MSSIHSIRNNLNITTMTYKFEQFTNEITPETIEIADNIILSRSKQTYSVTVKFMPQDQAVYFELPFISISDIESQVQNELKKYEIKTI